MTSSLIEYEPMPKEIHDILDANQIEFNNRLDACSKTPLINPNEIPLTVSRFSFRPDQEIYVCNDT